MSDPLFLLRQATINKTPPSLAEGYCDFGHIRLPENTKTNFRRTLKNDDYCYTILDIVYFLENINIPFAEYRRKLVEQVKRGVTAVTETDRPFLQQYLNGEIDTCSQIDHSLLQNIASLPSASVADNLTQDKSTKSREDRVKQKHESDEKVEKTEKGKREHKRKHEHISVDDDANPMDKAIIDGDKSVLSAIRAGEFAAYTRNSMLNTESANVDFASVLKIFNDTILRPKDQKSAEHQPNDKSTVGSNKVVPNTHVNKPSGAPIIVVPKAITSDINIFNIKQFLEEGKYVKVPQNQIQNRPKQVAIERISPVDSTKRLHYKVLDDPTTLPSEEWDRIVAVFAAGQTWQFRDWKYSEPVNLFQHARGFYIVADERTPDPKVLTWNCKLLKVNSVKNHVSTSASKDFWATLDEFVKYHRPQFDPSKL